MWEINTVVATVCISFGIMFFIIYMTLLPVVKKTPFRPYSILFLHRFSVLAGYIAIPIVDRIAQGCFIVLNFVTYSVLGRFARTFFDKDTLRTCTKIARSILPRRYQHMRVWWEDWFDDSLDQIDISPQVQEEAILWLSQMPLNPSETKAVVSSLALISPSRPHKFPQSVIVFLNSALESSCRGAPSRARIDSVLALGRIKYQSVVDQNRDQDHTVGDMPVTALVAYAAQQLTISAFEEEFSTPHSEGIRARLLAAAAWLSPVDKVEEVTPEGEPLSIQARSEFVQQIGMTLEQHFRGERLLDNGVLVDLIHGMHASIPRGDYGPQASIIPFPLFTRKDHSSLCQWSEDESALRALITYALDLLSYTERKRKLVEREIELDELALDLIDTLCGSVASAASADPSDPVDPADPAAPPVPPEVVVFSFWLVRRFPYAFRSRRTMLADIGNIWNSTKETIAEDHDHRKRLNFHAVDAFVAVARRHLIADRELPRLWAEEVLNLLNAAVKDTYSLPVVTYALALILNLGASKQAAEISRGIDVELFTDTFNTVRSDLEANATEEDVLNLYIHTALLLLKWKKAPADIERVKTLIGEMGRTIEGVVVGQDSVSKKNSEDETIIDTDRVRWKAIYLSSLLFKLLPPEEDGGPIENLREGVKTIVQNGQLLLAEDYKHCLKPLYGGPVKLKSPAERDGVPFTAFEAWINDFPLFPLAGSVLSPT